MTIVIFKLLFVFTISILIKMIFVNGSISHICNLENHTATLNIGKTPPCITVPVRVDFCSVITRWSFRFNTFLCQTRACTATRHRTE